MVSLFAPHLLPLVPWDGCVFVIVVFTAFLHFKFTYALQTFFQIPQ